MSANASIVSPSLWITVGGAVRRPEAGLAGPVGLHDVRDDGEQRVGARGLRGQQRLGGLAQPGLVGEQEGPVPRLGGGHHLRLVPHQLEAAGRAQGRRVGQVHAGRGAAGLEGPQQRTEELPRREPAGAGGPLLDGTEVGDHERARQLTGDDGLGDDAPLRLQAGVLGLGRRLLVRGRLLPRRLAHLALQRPGRVGDDRVVGEQGQQGRLAGGGLGQDGGDAVEPLQLLGPAGLGDGGVGLDPGALLAHQQGDGLEAGPQRGQRVAALDAGLDLADGAREHRHDALVVESAAAPLARRRPGVAGLTLTSSSQELLLRSGRGEDRRGTGHQPSLHGREPSRGGGRPATRCATRSSRSARDHRSGPNGPFAERTHRAPLGARDTAIVASGRQDRGLSAADPPRPPPASATSTLAQRPGRADCRSWRATTLRDRDAAADRRTRRAMTDAGSRADQRGPPVRGRDDPRAGRRDVRRRAGASSGPSTANATRSSWSATTSVSWS